MWLNIYIDNQYIKHYLIKNNSVLSEIIAGLIGDDYFWVKNSIKYI
jgi:hypothetical protein